MRDEVYDKNIGVAQDSGTVFQSHIIRGINENLKSPMTLCNLLPVSSYPKHYKDCIIRRMEFSHAKGAKDVNAGFFNFAYVKQLLLPVAYRSEVDRVMKLENFTHVICYSTSLTLLEGLKHIKKNQTNIISCVIVPDMPEFNDLSENQSKIYSWYLRRSASNFRKMLKYIDNFVFLTEQSASYLNAKKPFTVVEGIAEVSNLNLDMNDVGKKTVMYTGSTHIQFGVPNLLKAFKAIEGSEYELIICGCGDYDDEIIKASLSDSRIIHKGVVPHDEVIKLQSAATVLVNPRQNIGEFTKYSFPSKTMEYLASGVPVVAYKLDGIPDEYDDYIQYVNNNEIGSLKESIISACEEPIELRLERGRKARKFVENYKLAKNQTLKILDLLNIASAD